MPNKPKFIKFMSIVFALLAISFPVQIMFMFGYMPWEFVSIATKLTPLNYILIGFFFYASYLTYKTNKLVFIMLPFLNFFVFLNNFVVAEYGQVFTHAQTIVASTAFLLVTLSFYQKDIYNVYNDLKFRWWLTSPRFKEQMPVIISYQGEDFRCTTFDISRTGMFIKTDDLYKVFKIENNKDIEIKFIVGKKSIILQAQVVRKSIAKGQYPAGIGVHFNDQETTDKSEWEAQYMKQAA